MAEAANFGQPTASVTRWRISAEPVASSNASDDAIVRLPIAALCLPADTVGGLRRIGFDLMCELMATPRAPLSLRFGSDLGRRLDQMFGRASEPFDLVEAHDLIRVRRGSPSRLAQPRQSRVTLPSWSTSCAPRLGNRGLAPAS